MAYTYGNHTVGLYRSRHGILFGVCRGIADYFDFSAFWLRIIVLFTFLTFGHIFVAAAYLLAALLMKPRPRYIY